MLMLVGRTGTISLSYLSLMYNRPYPMPFCSPMKLGVVRECVDGFTCILPTSFLRGSRVLSKGIRAMFSIRL